jgi:hypothetical protein
MAEQQAAQAQSWLPMKQIQIARLSRMIPLNENHVEQRSSPVPRHLRAVAPQQGYHGSKVAARTKACSQSLSTSGRPRSASGEAARALTRMPENGKTLPVDRSRNTWPTRQTPPRRPGGSRFRSYRSSFAAFSCVWLGPAGSARRLHETCAEFPATAGTSQHVEIWSPRDPIIVSAVLDTSCVST